MMGGGHKWEGNASIGIGNITKDTRYSCTLIQLFWPLWRSAFQQRVKICTYVVWTRWPQTDTGHQVSTCHCSGHGKCADAPCRWITANTSGALALGFYLLLPLAGSSSPAASSALDWLSQQSTPLSTLCSLSQGLDEATPPKHISPPDPVLQKSTATNNVFLLLIKPIYLESKWWAIRSHMYFFFSFSLFFLFSSLPPLSHSLSPPPFFFIPVGNSLPWSLFHPSILLSLPFSQSIFIIWHISLALSSFWVG